MKKTLNSLKANPENINNYRTITIRCLFKGCILWRGAKEIVDFCRF
jgi:hypothetical protein